MVWHSLDLVSDAEIDVNMTEAKFFICNTIGLSHKKFSILSRNFWESLVPYILQTYKTIVTKTDCKLFPELIC